MKYFIVFIFLFSFSSFGQSAYTKIDDIRKFLVVGGTEANLKVGMQTMIPMMKKSSSYSELSDEFWDGFMKEIDYKELIELYVPIYDKYYTHQEIKDLILFYESPTGKKTVEKMPLIMAESMTLGQKLGEKLGQKVLEKMGKN